jgi:para-nitrobenzyl esterase
VNVPGRNVEAFLGVPFASPPVGELRWRPPQPVDDTGATRRADGFAPACFQGDHITAWYRDVVAGFGGDPDQVHAPEVSEDCLYLNVWRPSPHLDQRLPVIVYVHGGSNRGGWSYEPNYHGHELASRGAVVVTIAYRLGPFGFFAHPELQGSNFALQDIVASLTWVKRWAGELGGDPDRITVMGESAGASNISLLLAVPQAQGLFNRMILQSSGWAIREIPTLAAAQSLGQALQAKLGARDLARLRELPSRQIDLAAKQVYADSRFDPVSGGEILPVALSEKLAASDIPPIDLLVGSNADEWKMYLEPGATVEDWLLENLPLRLHERARNALDGYADDQRALDALIAANAYVCPSMDLARAVEAAGGSSWMYYFSRVRPGEKAAGMGAYHGAELPYVFNTHDSWLPTDGEDRRLSDAMMGYWISFAGSGNPNASNLPLWPEFGSAGKSVMQLDTELVGIDHPS